MNKRHKQIDVEKFVLKNVPEHLRPTYRSEFVNWDNSLYGLPFSKYPSYEEDLCWQLLDNIRKYRSY